MATYSALVATRRFFVTSLPFAFISRAAFAACIIPEPYLSQKYVAPRDTPSRITIVDKDEPGTRMVVSGQVTDGQKPLAGVSVYIFHADANGRYTKEGKNDDEQARLHGAMRTDANGHFRYETIRPKAYEPAFTAHVHYIVRANGYKARMEELRFEDDREAFRELEGSGSRATKTDIGYVSNFCSGSVFQVRPVMRDAQGIWHVTHNIVLERE